MYRILKRKELNSTTTLMEIYAPMVARRAEPGQFIILRVDKMGERLPLTIADFNRDTGSVTIIFQVTGATTAKLDMKKEGDYLQDFVGPLGNKTRLDGVKKVVVVGGGVGCAIAYPIAKKLHNLNVYVHSIAGFRSEDAIILEEEFKNVSDEYSLATDDGSKGVKGFVTNVLDEVLKKDDYDLVVTIGPLIMMKFICEITKKYNIRTIVSMNSIMIDGTGMCGSCRVTVDGVTKFACIDGPDFDGFKIDFDEVMQRNKMYHSIEKEKHRSLKCNLFSKEITDE